MTDPDVYHWHLTLRPEFLEKARDDEALHELLALCRIVNALRFAEAAAIDRGDRDSPDSNRQREAGFLYTCGVLAEALIFLDRLAKHFRETIAYRDLILPIMKNPEIVALRSEYLSPLRNEAVFHNDRSVFAEGLARIRMRRYTLAEGASQRQGDVHYALADHLAVGYLILRKVSDSAQFYAELERVLALTGQVVLDLCLAADALVKEVLSSESDLEVRSGEHWELAV